MVLWCVLRMYNDGEVEGEDSRHDQEGLDPKDKVVSEKLMPRDLALHWTQGIE